LDWSDRNGLNLQLRVSEANGEVSPAQIAGALSSLAHQQK